MRAVESQMSLSLKMITFSKIRKYDRCLKLAIENIKKFQVNNLRN